MNKWIVGCKHATLFWFQFNGICCCVRAFLLMRRKFTWEWWHKRASPSFPFMDSLEKNTRKVNTAYSIHWMPYTSSLVIATIEWWRANTGEQCLLNTNYRKFHFKNAFTNSMCTYVSVHRKLSEVEFVRIRLQNDSNLTEFLDWSS